MTQKHRVIPEADRPAAGGWHAWFFGVVIIGALIGAVLHFGEIQNFGRLVTRAQPVWLGLAILFQISTYVSVAAGWAAVLNAAGTPRPMRRLVRIAVSKLFADQAVPSAGMGGNILLVDQLCGLRVPRGTAVAALLVSMIGFYAAYAAFALLMLALLWLHDKATPLMAGLVTTFLLVALAIPSLALWLRHRGSEPLPPRLERFGVVRTLLDSVAQAPSALLADRHLLATVTVCNALIFVADAGSFFACLRALGQPVSPETAYIALIMASIVVTLGPIPMGLGSFEATAVATLHLLGTPVEAAFAGTMLLRLLTLWLPLIPGIIMMRSGLKRHRKRSRPRLWTS